MLQKMAQADQSERLPQILSRSATHTAVFDYALQHSGDLELSEGDPVVLLEELADGWAKGTPLL
jgi:hypothetical protein